MNHYQDDPSPIPDWETWVPRPGPSLVGVHSLAGERIRPIAKPGKRSECEWWVGIGWVHNPRKKRSR